MASIEPILQYEKGVRVYTFKPGQLLKCIRLTADADIQTGDGLTKARAGSFVVTSVGGQQFPLPENVFCELMDGVPGAE